MSDFHTAYGEDCDKARARIHELETALMKIYIKAAGCNPAHYNQTMTEIIDITCSTRK